MNYVLPNIRHFFHPAVIAFLLLGSACENDVQRGQLEAEMDRLMLENDSLRNAAKVWEQSNPVRYDEAFDTIEKPDEYIKNSMRDRADLIPKDAELGGKMQFSNIEVLNNRLIFAEYEDGHVMGSAIYSYNLDENGNLNVELISTVEE